MFRTKITKCELKLFSFNLLLLISLVLSIKNAHADFRKAVDAYIAHDGATMLREVNEAVENNHNDSLGLLITAMNIDASTSQQKDISRIWMGSQAKHFVDAAQVKTTLATILTEQQQTELFNALQKAVDRDSIDTQYMFPSLLYAYKRTKLLDGEKRTKEFAEKGSYLAKKQLARGLAANAEMGDFASELNLGFKYLNFESDWGYGCEKASKEVLCQTKNEEKGYYWLKQALKTALTEKRFDGEWIAAMGMYSDAMCDYFHKTANGDAHKLRQAYLWCVVSLNSGGSPWGKFKRMNEDGTLKTAAPEAKAWWSMNALEREKRFEPLILSEFKELPDLMLEAQKELSKNNLPVFSYFFADYRITPYLLDIYADGRVVINDYSQWNKGSLWLKVTPNTVKKFLKDLKKLEFEKWTLFNTSFQFCDNFDPCIWSYVKATQNQKGKTRTVMMLEPPYLAEDDYDDLSTLRVAKLQALVEKYFPTQKLRCELGGSEGYKAACIAREARWAELAKRTPKEKK